MVDERVKVRNLVFTFLEKISRTTAAAADAKTNDPCLATENWVIRKLQILF